MKAEINLENKQKFYSLYYLQDVFYNPMLGETYYFNGVNIDELEDDDSCILRLKSISSLTVEDHEFILSSNFTNNIDLICEDKIGNYYESDIYTTDYLRSKGYALPFMGLSVEEMVEAGWIELEK